MTVAQLKEHLNMFDDELEVIINDTIPYEGLHGVRLLKYSDVAEHKTGFARTVGGNIYEVLNRNTTAKTIPVVFIDINS